MSEQFLDNGNARTKGTRSRSSVRMAAAALTASACLLASGEARAQSRDPVAATELFMQGREAVKQRDYEKACPLFAESSRLDLKVGTLLNLADCEEHVGQLAEALQHWKQAVQLGTATRDRRAEEACRRLDALEGRVPRLIIHLAPDAPASTRVTRDGVELGQATLGVPLPVNPGEHEIEVITPGHAPKRYAAAVAEGEVKELDVTVGGRLPERPEATEAPLVPPRAAPEPVAEPDNSLAYVLGGVGIAGVVVGSITGAMLIDKNRTIDAQCNADNECTEQGLAAVEDAKGLVPISNVAWVVGVVGLGASTYLFVTSGPSAPGDEGAGALRRPHGIGLRLAGDL